MVTSTLSIVLAIVTAWMIIESLKAMYYKVKHWLWLRDKRIKQRITDGKV